MKNGRKLKRPWRLTLGIGLIIGGLFGLCIPITPGLALIFVGGYILKGFWKKDKKNITEKKR